MSIFYCLHIALWVRERDIPTNTLLFEIAPRSLIGDQNRQSCTNSLGYDMTVILTFSGHIKKIIPRNSFNHFFRLKLPPIIDNNIVREVVNHP